MWYAIKKLSFGIFLIFIAAGILLFSDWNNRIRIKTDLPYIAIVQFATSPLMAESVRGGLASFKKAGYHDGQTINIKYFNAENDIPTAGGIARAILDGGFDMVMTFSTPCLQAMASANKEGKIVHVFGAVTDPFGAGVGISRTDPFDHPAHLAGIGTFQPVEESIQLALKMYPDLKILGTVWNPAEACSEACIRMARASCAQLGIQLVEANVESSSAVMEATQSLIGRGAQAIWIGGDNTVLLAIASITKVAGQNGLPVFTNQPSDIGKGTLFGLGADYVEVGRLTGQLAVEILNGRSPADIPIENVVPQQLTLNLPVLKQLRNSWRIDHDLVEKAAVVIDEQGNRMEKNSPGQVTESADAVTSGQQSARKWQIVFLNYTQVGHVEQCHDGFFSEFKKLGMIQGRDYDMKMMNAMGDMATLVSMVDTVTDGEPDLVLLTSTPTLQTVINKITDIPVLFSNVANAVAAGAGTSNEDHISNITGISSMQDPDAMIRLIRECMPDVKTIGTLFCPAEFNSVWSHESFLKAAKNAGIKVISVASSSTSEVPSAMLSLLSRGVDVVCPTPDNLHDAAFSGIIQAADKAKKPVIAFLNEDGASVCFVKSFSSAGKDLARLALRVLKGANPADIPISLISKTDIIVNLKKARLMGLKIPQSLLERADKIIE